MRNTHQVKRITIKLWTTRKAVTHCSTAEDSGLPCCNAGSLFKLLPTFRKITIPSLSSVKHTKNFFPLYAYRLKQKGCMIHRNVRNRSPMDISSHQEKNSHQHEWSHTRRKIKATEIISIKAHCKIYRCMIHCLSVLWGTMPQSRLAFHRTLGTCHHCPPDSRYQIETTSLATGYWPAFVRRWV